MPHDHGLPAETKASRWSPDITTTPGDQRGRMLAKLPTLPLSAPTGTWPVIDGYVLPDDPGVLLGTSDQAEGATARGHNADEAFFYRNESPPNTFGISRFRRQVVSAGNRRQGPDDYARRGRRPGRRRSSSDVLGFQIRHADVLTARAA